MALQGTPTGLMKDMLSQIGLGQLSTPPTMENQEITITITEQEMEQVMKKGLDERTKNSITLKITDGKVLIKVRLW
jgi:hypothetical protein